MSVRVLVVDDASESREILQRALSLDNEIEVVGEADSGVEAVRQAEEQRPDVILMDVRMPGGDGIAATEEITRRFPHVQVIALTAHDDQDSVRQMLTAGAAGYLVKGASVDDLTTAIRRASAGEALVDRRVLPHVLEELRTLLSQERRRRADAERLATAREEFIQVLSHELRTPLTVIAGALQFLETQGLDPEAEELVAAGLKRTDDLKRMVEGLELIGQGPPAPDVATTPADAVNRALLTTPGHPDQTEIEDGPWPGVPPAHVTRVVIELVTNALRHGRPPVSLTVGRRGPHGVVLVTDDGDFEPEPSLFGPFVQGDMSTQRRHGGMGLGLFVAGRLCELGGGRLDVRREHGHTVAEARFRLSG
ncbi:MAG: ATP-binding response regulator [Actinomycetota bacterium]